jgi:hypothetical protein
MLRLSPFKTRKPKSFQYQPRFFDPDKEALQDRIARIKAESEGSISDRDVRMRDAFAQRKRKAASTATKGQLILIALLGATVVAYAYLPLSSFFLFSGGLLVYYWLKKRGTL